MHRISLHAGMVSHATITVQRHSQHSSVGSSRPGVAPHNHHHAARTWQRNGGAPTAASECGWADSCSYAASCIELRSQQMPNPEIIGQSIEFRDTKTVFTHCISSDGVPSPFQDLSICRQNHSQHVTLTHQWNCKKQNGTVFW
jgi:hypothetical protein